jgi:hypothetical protein
MQRMKSENQKWTQPRKKRAILKRSLKQNTQPNKQSASLAKDGASLMEKSTKGWRISTTTQVTPLTYLILLTLGIYKLAMDSKISVGNQEEIDHQLDLFKAQELAQIAIDKFEKQNMREKKVSSCSCKEVLTGKTDKLLQQENKK